VVGFGQTHHKSRRKDVSFGGLVREAALRALDDAHMTFADIDAVVIGKAPDLFEGVMKPELYLSDALGAVGKPMFRVHTAGSVGGTTAIVAASHVQARKHERVLAVAFENQSEGNAQFAARPSARVARSRRSSARTSSAAAPPSTSGGRSRSRTGRTR
jgi:acetyl-CoA C-acetyltransferase